LQLTYSSQDVATAVALVSKHKIEQAVDDASICIEALTERGPVFVTGYCYGGSVSWAAACRIPGLSGASCYYGSRIPDLAHEILKCPVALHFGEFDREIPLERVLLIQAQRSDVEMWMYPAGHGFNSDRRDDFHAPSAKLARKRTLELFSA